MQCNVLFAFFAEIGVNKAVTIVKNGFTAVIVAGEGFEVADTDTEIVIQKSDETERTPAIIYTDNTLYLKGMISITQYLAFSNVDMTKEEILANGGMEITLEDGTSYIAELTYSGWYNGKEEYKAKTEGIPAKNMGDSMVFRPFITVEGQKYYGAEKTYSVKIYAEEKFGGNASEGLKKTLVGLLNYGAEAQLYFKHKTNSLMNASIQSYVDSGNLNADYLEQNWNNDYLTPIMEPNADMVANFPTTGTISINARTLYLKGAVSINYYYGIGFDASAFKNASEAKYYFWTMSDYEALANTGTALTKENASYTADAELVNSGAKYGYEYTAISGEFPAKNFGDTLYAVLCVTDANGTVHCSGVSGYSPEAYAEYKINDGTYALIDDVMKWMVVYGERAKAYLASM